MKEFNLSEKKVGEPFYKDNGDLVSEDWGFYFEKDIKEFIKKLKENSGLIGIRKQVFIENLNKLAGEELSK